MKNETNGFWDEQRVSASIKLGAWLLFIVAILVIFSFSNRETSEDKEKETDTYNFKTYEKMQEDLLTGNYDYVYTLNVKGKEYIFNGTKCKNEDHGYKETSNGIIKYVVTENEMYQVELGKYNAINNLYDNINRVFITPSILFDNLKSTIYNVSKNDDTRTINYNHEKWKISVKTDLERIRIINIKDGKDEYKLEFTNTNKCDSISLGKN